MRKIERNAIPVPHCLAAPPPERRYADLHGVEKDEIRDALHAIQKLCCAYCERRTGDERDDGHIEHFRKQADNPGLDLVWSNIFWSCNDEKTCGKNKDKCIRAGGQKASFNPDDLINPCIDNPDEYFLFVTDGTIQLREGLSPDKERRANETLRVFRLAESAFLRKAREDAVKPYVNAVTTLLSAGSEMVSRYVQDEMANIESVPFSTAIRHFFLSYSP